MKNKQKHGDLRVWWVPQVPMSESFTVPVASLAEAKLLLNTLADYDAFQFRHKIKPDYTNAGGLQVFTSLDNEWVDWGSESGDEIDSYSLDDLRTTPPKWEGENDAK